MLDQPASASLNTVSDESSAPVGLFDQALASAREFTVVARDHLDVFVVEVRQAAVNLALVIGAGIVMAVLVVFAWSTLMDAATVGATETRESRRR